LSAPQDPLAAIGGGVLLLRGREGRVSEGREEGTGRNREGEGKGEGREEERRRKGREEERRGRERKGGKSIASSLFNFWPRAWHLSR